MSSRHPAELLGLGTTLVCVLGLADGCGGKTGSFRDHTRSDGEGGATGSDGRVGMAGARADGATGGSAVSEPGLATGGVVTTSNDDDDDDNDNDNDVVVDYPCVRLPKSSNALITDFREIELGTAWESGQEKWGTSNGLNGGTFHYQGDGDSLRATRVDSGLGLTGIVPAGSYAGFGLWFVNCIDASDFDGISFSLAGDTDGVTLRFQLQMNSNYPIDTANSKGACAYSSEETKWDECTNNSVRASQIDAVERDYSYTWDRFVGGQPVSPLNPREIMGLQWQFDCEADTDCSVDLTIGDLWFFQLV